MNKLWYGDNLTIMQNMRKHSVDLIYLDPPFNSKRNYNLLYKTMTGKPVPEQVEGKGGGTVLHAFPSRRAFQYKAVQDSVLDIMASPSVRQFCVGVTGNPTSRRAAYARWCKKHGGQLKGFVILDWERSPDAILEMERWLFEALKSHKKYANHGHVKYFASVNRTFADQCTYVAWWSPAFWPPR